MDDIDDVSKERSCSSQNMGMAQCGTMEPTSPTWRPRSTRDTLRTPQSTAAKQPGINPDQKKQAIRPETPKMDQNGSSPTRNHRKFPQISKVKKHQSQRSFLSYLVTPFRRALFRQKSMTSTTHLRRYGATALARPRGRCAQSAAHRRCPADITSSNSHHGCFNKCWDDQC